MGNTIEPAVEKELDIYLSLKDQRFIELHEGYSYFENSRYKNLNLRIKYTFGFLEQNYSKKGFRIPTDEQFLELYKFYVTIRRSGIKLSNEYRNRSLKKLLPKYFDWVVLGYETEY